LRTVGHCPDRFFHGLYHTEEHGFIPMLYKRLQFGYIVTKYRQT